MALPNIEAVDEAVQELLDATRNAHLQLVIGEQRLAIECLRDAAAAHGRLHMRRSQECLSWAPWR
jgi:hypothetical protein